MRFMRFIYLFCGLFDWISPSRMIPEKVENDYKVKTKKTLFIQNSEKIALSKISK